MRQIKFKGRRLDNCRWVYGSLAVVKDECFIGKAADPVNPVYKTTWTAVDTNTVCQFTGLLDKNGREIYEGDLLEWKELSHKKQGVVVWHDYGFLVVHYRPTGTEVRLVMKEFYDAEVIGNIHDNPELQEESPTPQTSQEKEIQIGDIIEVGGEKYIAEEATEGQDCDCCDLMDFSNCLQLCGHCSSDYRKDGNDLLFKKIGGKE